MEIATERQHIAILLGAPNMKSVHCISFGTSTYLRCWVEFAKLLVLCDHGVRGEDDRVPGGDADAVMAS